MQRLQQTLRTGTQLPRKGKKRKTDHELRNPLLVWAFCKGFLASQVIGKTESKDHEATHTGQVQDALSFPFSASDNAGRALAGRPWTKDARRGTKALCQTQHRIFKEKHLRHTTPRLPGLCVRERDVGWMGGWVGGGGVSCVCVCGGGGVGGREGRGWVVWCGVVVVVVRTCAITSGVSVGTRACVQRIKRGPMTAHQLLRLD